MIVSEQLNYIKTRRFHAIFMSVIIEFSRCIGTYSSAKFELFISTYLCMAYKLLSGIIRPAGDSWGASGLDWSGSADSSVLPRLAG